MRKYNNKSYNLNSGGRMKDEKMVMMDFNAMERICPECATKLEKYSSCISGEYYKCPKCGAVDN